MRPIVTARRSRPPIASQDEKLCENAQRLGEVMRAELRSVTNPAIATVRGKGLLNAVVVKPTVRARHRYPHASTPLHGARARASHTSARKPHERERG